MDNEMNRHGTQNYAMRMRTGSTAKEEQLLSTNKLQPSFVQVSNAMVSAKGIVVGLE